MWCKISQYHLWVKRNEINRSKIFLFSLFTTLLLLGCANNETTSEPERVPVNSIAQMVGVCQSEKGFHYFSEDGMHEFGHSREGLRNRMKSSPEGDFWFEDGIHYHTSELCETQGITTPGIYEVYLIENDTLLFVAIEVGCPVRKNWLAGYADINSEFLWTRSE
jgi:hypothetical protein